MIKIYLIINLINNKKYVGQTSQTIKERWKRHLWKSSLETRFPIKNAIVKHGKNNFVICEIDSTDSIDRANEKEIFWGLFYNALSHGYSLRLGGRKTIHISDEIKQKISKSNTGKKASEETKAKLKIARNKRTIPPKAYIKANITRLKNNPNCHKEFVTKSWQTIRASGRTQTTTDKSHWQTPEHRQKCSTVHIKRLENTGRKFICNETKEIFNNCGQCARQMKLNSYKCVWKCLHGKIKTYGGFTFTYLDEKTR